METISKNEVVFAITKEDLQNEANKKLGRNLSNEEIITAKKGLEYGLLTSIDVVYNTIFTEMIKSYNSV